MSVSPQLPALSISSEEVSVILNKSAIDAMENIAGMSILQSEKAALQEMAKNELAEVTIEKLNKPLNNDVADSKFTWELRGKKITLDNLKLENISYVKRCPEDLIVLRNEFNTVIRKNFLKELGKTPELLKTQGLSDIDILKIQNGKVPNGWQIHHKLPLDDSGTNSFDNLVLIQNEPYHKVITNYQNNMTSDMTVGDVKQIQWPIPNDNIYPMKK